jgi:hypothetical protein
MARQPHRRRFALVAALALAVAAAFGTTASADSDTAAMTASLSGAEEVPTNDSLARGTAVFKLSDDGLSLHYSLSVANLDNLSQAHIHIAPAGVNGPVVAWLYPSGPPPQLIPGRTSGILATGTITASDLVGPLAGMSFEALLNAIRAGDAYVNVHTSAFPGGEIRGQIAAHGS